MSRIFDPFREAKVRASPEEGIRQALLKQLTGKLGYPEKWIAVEKSLSHFRREGELPPDRRVDILCFTPTKEGTAAPLLLIECKAHSFSEKGKAQVLHYNHFIQAPFVAIACRKGAQTGWFDKLREEYTFMEGIPSYTSLLKSTQYVDPTH